MMTTMQTPVRPMAATQNVQSSRPAMAKPVVAQPQAPDTVSFSRTSGVKFGSCVNAATSKAQFQERLLTEDLRSRLHAIASAGNVANEDFADVLSDLLLRQGAFGNEHQNKRSGDQLYEFTLMAMVDTALKNPKAKDQVIKNLEEAKKARHLRKQYALIDEALKKLKGNAHTHSARWTQAQQEYQQEQRPHRH